MNKLVVCVLLFLGVVLAQQLGTNQPPECLVPCAFLGVIDCPNSCGIDRSGCCPTCCTEPCAQCFVNPCDGFHCSGFPGYTCEANYCGGCNRDWYDSAGNYVVCEEETKEAPCALVDCLPPELLDCSGGCGSARGDGCCEECCTECAACFVDPCDGYVCGGHSEYTCEANYCGGCNRDWYDSAGHKTICQNEEFGGSGNNDDGDSTEWNVDCKHDEDCALMNTDRGFDCCSIGGCDNLDDRSENAWQPVNLIWWQTKHDNCASVSLCIPPPQMACIEMYVEPTYKAVCHRNECSKVKVDSPNQPKNDDSGSSSNAAFLAAGALMLVPIIAL